MATMTGNDGTATYSAVAIEITQWEFTAEAEEIDVTDSGTASNAREYLASRTGVSGSFGGFSQDTVAEQVGGASAALILLAKPAGSTAKQWSGTAVILSANVVCDVAGAEAVKVNYTFRVTGAWTAVQYAA